MRNDSVHPDPENLLRLVDGELPSREIERVKQHLEACWQCRAEMDGLEKAAAECVRYRKLENSLMPEAPRPWFDIRREFAALEAVAKPSVAERLGDAIGSLFASPMRLAPTGLALLAIGWATYSFRYAPSAQAAALLERAVSAQPGSPAKIKPRRVQISTASRKFTRLLAPKAVPAAALTEDDELKAVFMAAHYSWDDPLSAASFRDWRDQLESKSDTVSTTGARYEITTSTTASSLESAALSLDASDLHAVATRFEFRGHGAVSITELPDIPEVAANPLPILPAPEPGSAPAEIAKPEALAAVASASDELQVFLRLHRVGADLGEPVEVERTGTAIVVRSSGLDPSRRQELSDALAGLPRVSVEVGEIPAGPAARTSAPTTVRAEASPVQERIQQFVGGRPAFERLAGQVLDASDRAMARAHALRRLAERFTVPAESSLVPLERQQLTQLRKEHSAALAREAAAVRMALGGVLTALAGAEPDVTVGVPSDWQDGAEQIFQSALKLDRQLSAALGASSTQSSDPAEVFTELVRLNGLLQAYHQK
jgi:hypothetical protein